MIIGFVLFTNTEKNMPSNKTHVNIERVQEVYPEADHQYVVNKKGELKSHIHTSPGGMLIAVTNGYSLAWIEAAEFVERRS